MDADFLLIRKMKQGNDDAFDQFIRKYYEEILKYCNYHCHDAEYAKDITQETFIRFFINLSEYHYKGKTKNYLYTIAGNLCKNFYKKKKEALLEDNLFETTYVQDTRQLDIVLDHIIIEDAIKKLPKELREVVILYYFQELKLKEIANMLCIGLPLAKYRLGQARKRLKQILGTEELYGAWRNNEKIQPGYKN